MYGNKTGKKDLLLAVDIETTGLDPEWDLPLEITYRVGTFPTFLDPVEPGKKTPGRHQETHLVYPASTLMGSMQKTAAVFVTMTKFVREMHTNNGLFADLGISPKNGLPDNAGSIPLDGERGAKDIDQKIYTALVGMYPDLKKGKRKLTLVSSSPAGVDMPFLKKYFKQTYSLLHYRSIDVSAVRGHYYFVKGKDPSPKKDKSDKPHRSASDLQATLDEWGRYIEFALP